MNKMILIEKFSTQPDVHTCLDISVSTNKCDGSSPDDINGLDQLFDNCDDSKTTEQKKIAMKCADDDSNKDVCCDNDNDIVQYCTYLNSIKKLLWGNCLTCEKKKTIINAVKRSKCNNTIQ